MIFQNFKRWYRLQHHPLKCAVCDTFFNLEFHHIQPVALFPKLECVESNIVILCRSHHFHIGHLGDWTNYNSNILIDIERYRTAKFDSFEI